MTQKLKFQEGKVTTKQVSVLARRARENGRTPDKLYSEIRRFRNMMDIGTTSSEDRLRRGIRDLNTFAKDMLTKLQSDAPVNPQIIKQDEKQEKPIAAEVAKPIPKQEKITLNDLFELCIASAKKGENWQEISKKYFESGQLDDAELMDAYNKARKEDPSQVLINRYKDQLQHPFNAALMKLFGHEERQEIQTVTLTDLEYILYIMSVYKRDEDIEKNRERVDKENAGIRRRHEAELDATARARRIEANDAYFETGRIPYRGDYDICGRPRSNWMTLRPDIPAPTLAYTDLPLLERKRTKEEIEQDKISAKVGAGRSYGSSGVY
ncbi:MAG: hypothetical protein AABX38_04785 [Candidatus Micrarchaeota archaeon]